MVGDDSLLCAALEPAGAPSGYTSVCVEESRFCDDDVRQPVAADIEFPPLLAFRYADEEESMSCSRVISSKI